ncbi:ATP-binding protein [Paenibacillus polymyxa]|uniref:ATP-binding protein n=2 Tax=Paenibacillus polymyxa TaxID=1406 RepID=UPI000D88FE86|nr:ATP-binding protein [Paenibacillus polymyxa]SPY18923.1 ATP-binding protein [Paenibacillus polymyxa]
MTTSINLTPNPRILQMLGQIEFENWQCIAELVDNSIDALLKDFNNGRTDRGEIRVSIPTFTQYTEGSPITIWDNGPGMNINQLENALKAGYSSNDPTSNLGLFGMGFNISTARIGDRTSVFTSQKGEPNEIGIEIDFQDMILNNSYDRPVLSKHKDNSYISGTTIKIYKLKERVSHLGQQGISSLKKQLSKVYSKLIRDYNIEIYVNGDKLVPNKKCIWSPERYVIRNHEKIPAYLEVNENLGDMYFCSCCWNWLDAPVIEGLTPPICKICETSDFVSARERIISGWLGIQRYYDKDDYGVDFYRNGRLIVANDKSLFYWKNPETGEPEIEYPVDALHFGGRIVGELETNFVKVTYTKDSIEKMDKHWDALTKKIRGEAPIRPNIAQDFGYPKNGTYIARLFGGYRKANKPGREDLLPGKYNSSRNKWEADNVQPKAWAELFYKGESEYQDDHKWWDLVEQVEENRRSSNIAAGEGSGEEDFLNPNFPSGDSRTNVPPIGGEPPISGIQRPLTGDAEVAVTSVVIDTEEDSLISYVKDEYLSGVYKVDELGEDGIVLDVFINNSLTQEKPLIIEKLSYSNYKAYYNPNSNVFKSFANSVKEYLLMELANSLYLRKNDPDEWSITKIFYLLKLHYCKEESFELNNVKYNANNLLTTIKNKLSVADIRLVPEITLDREDYQTLQRAVLSKLGEGDSKVRELIVTTKFLSFMPNSFVLKFFTMYPTVFFDGVIWRKPFSEIIDTDIQQEIIQEFYSYLTDIVWLIKYEEEVVVNNFHRFKRNIESLRSLGELTGE